jgi:hypothetical protein
MLDKHLGKNFKDIITSRETNEYPLLICLSFNDGQVEIVDVIQGSTSRGDTLKRLREARSTFDRRIVSPLRGHQ